MATLKDIRKRINGVENTGKITRAMKMISAIKLRRAQQKMLMARKYDHEVARVLREVLNGSIDINHPLMTERSGEKKKIDLIIITSDRGMCGAFNENLLKHVRSYIADKVSQGAQVGLYVLGKKGRDHLKRRGYEIKKELVNISEQEIPVYLEKAEIAFGARYLAGDADETVVVYNSFKSAGSQEIVFKRVLPVKADDRTYKYGIEHIYEADKDEIVDYLAKESVMSMLYLAYQESTASEIAARMVSMEKATKNADDLIKALILKMNKVRQGAITNELIEIVSGANSINEG